MKGLLLKDLYIIRGFEKHYGIILALILFLSFIMKDLSIVAMYLVIICSMLVISTLSIDETVHFDKWVLTTPAGAKNLAREKYVLLVLTMGAGLIMGLLVRWISELLFHAENFTTGIDGLLTPILMFTVGYAVMLPASFKVGMEKARYVLMATMFGLSGIAVGWFKAYTLSKSVLLKNATDNVLMQSASLRSLSIIGICMLLLTISYRISLRIIRNKDW